MKSQKTKYSLTVWNLRPRIQRVKIFTRRKRTGAVADDEPISTEANASEKIQLGSTVILKLGDGTQSTYEIVWQFETNPARGHISHKSPLGVALASRKK